VYGDGKSATPPISVTDQSGFDTIPHDFVVVRHNDSRHSNPPQSRNSLTDKYEMKSSFHGLEHDLGGMLLLTHSVSLLR
jgi:hypothetical protein